MTVRIFAYKGNLGATSDTKNGKFINDIFDRQQLGVVVDSSEVEITPEAKKIIKNAGRDGGSFSTIMLTKHSDGSGSSIGLIGFGKHHFGKEVLIGRTCEKEVLNDFNEVNFDVPEDYKKFIDNQSN